MLMSIRNIDLNLLYIFISVYESKSITLAAERLSLSQPAVSNALTRLKKTLNQTLFINKNRQILPTRLADAFYKEIKGSFNIIENSLLKISNFVPEDSQRTFHIATCNCGDLILFPKLIPFLKKHAPNVSINRIPFSDINLEQQVLKGDLDLMMFFDFPVGNEVSKEHLFYDSMSLVTGPQHHSLPSKLSIDELMTVELVGHGSGFEQYIPLLAHFKENKIYSNQQLSIENIWSVLDIVVTSDLAAVVPTFFAKKVTKYMPLRIHQLDDNIASLSVCLYWRESESEDRGHQWLRSVVRNIVLEDQKNDCL
ncbi:MAG: LysR substrate-binding domain-containing protein [Methylococcales bacterium]